MEICCFITYGYHLLIKEIEAVTHNDSHTHHIDPTNAYYTSVVYHYAICLGEVFPVVIIFEPNPSPATVYAV